YLVFFFQAEDGIRDRNVTGVQTCALPISDSNAFGCGFKATQSLPRRDSRPLRRPDAADFRTTGRPEPGAHTADSSAFSCGCSTSFPPATCRLWPPSRGSMSNRSMTAFRLASRYTALLVTVLTVASLIGLGPALAAGPPSGLGEVPVLTAPNAYGPGIWHHAKAGKTWYGSYRTFPDTSAYCI